MQFLLRKIVSEAKNKIKWYSSILLVSAGQTLDCVCSNRRKGDRKTHKRKGRKIDREKKRKKVDRKKKRKKDVMDNWPALCSRGTLPYLFLFFSFRLTINPKQGSLSFFCVHQMWVPSFVRSFLHKLIESGDWHFYWPTKHLEDSYRDKMDKRMKSWKYVFIS